MFCEFCGSGPICAVCGRGAKRPPMQGATVTLMKATEKKVRVRFSNHFNELTGERFPTVYFEMAKDTFCQLAAAHSLTIDHFAIGRGVTVSEPA